MGGLNELISKVEKKHGPGYVMAGLQPLREMKSTLLDYPRLMTGIFPLDVALGGGVPFITPTQFFGPPEAGKSLTSYIVARTLSRTCLNPGCLKPLSLCKCENPKVQKTFLAHFEGAPPDDIWFETLRYKTDENLVIALPDYAEQGCEMIEAAAKSDDCGLIIVDSIGSMMPKVELTSSYEDTLVGRHSSVLTRFIKRISNILVSEFRRGHLVCLIMINQIRSVIGNMYGPTEGIPGGYALKHGVKLSVRFGQLSVDRSKDNTKPYLKCSASMLSHAAKQQLFIGAGKAEFRVSLFNCKEAFPGLSMDVKTVIATGRSLDVIKGDSTHGYRIEGISDMHFRVLSELENVFRTGEPEGLDDTIRYLVLDKVKEKLLEKTRRNEVDILTLGFTEEPDG